MTAGEVYVATYLDSLLAEQKDGGDPHLGIGIAQDALLWGWLRPYGKLEALFVAKNRDGSSHGMSLRYSVGIEARHESGLFIQAERSAWNPLTYGKTPKGLKPLSGDIAHYWMIKSGIKW